MLRSHTRAVHCFPPCEVSMQSSASCRESIGSPGGRECAGVGALWVQIGSIEVDSLAAVEASS